MRKGAFGCGAFQPGNERARKVEKAHLVLGVDPNDRTATRRFALEVSFLNEVKVLGLRSFLAQGLGLVIGAGIGGSVLSKPTAIYRGLKRELTCPYPRRWHRDEQDAINWFSGDRVHIYVSKPDRTFEIGQGLESKRAPTHSVFLTYVRFWDDLGGQPQFVDPGTQQKFTPDGLIASWEWAMCSPGDGSLPEEYDTRYGKRVTK